MELWIRSQDKEDLIKVDNLGLAYLGKYGFVDKIGDIHREEYHVCQFTNDYHTTLGYYKTKERALEVLDEIQKKINLINLGHDFGSPMIDLNNPVYIYEMPED